MNKNIIILLLNLTICLVCINGSFARAQEADLIDRTNYEKAQGLVPDAVLEWIKKGDTVFNLETIDFNPADFFPTWVHESRRENIGRYTINEDDEIVDAQTNKRPGFIKGLPFPTDRISQDDPKAAVKIIYNGYYARDVYGPINMTKRFLFVGRKGFERKVDGRVYIYPADGYPPAKDQPNPHDIQDMGQVIVLEPFDMAGIAMMTWRYRSKKQDTLFSYAPATRRVRRTTPVGRSDTFLGTDFVRDDGGWPGYDGKIPEFEWKLIGQKEVLGCYLTPKPLQCFKNKNKAWEIESANSAPVWGYEKEGWTGAPWINTNCVWVKRPVWIIEMQARDKKYNYGKQTVYIDQETFMTHWKEIRDKKGNYWKTFHNSSLFFTSDDNTYKGNLLGTQNIVDERKDHASVIMQHINGRYIWLTADPSVRREQFTLSGFTKLCK